MPFASESERFSWCLLQNATINPSMQSVGAVVDQLRIEIKDKQMQKGKKKEKLPASTRRRKKARSKRYWNNFLETLLHFDNTVRHWGSSVFTATFVCPSSFKQNFQLGSYAHLFFFFFDLSSACSCEQYAWVFTLRGQKVHFASPYVINSWH